MKHLTDRQVGQYFEFLARCAAILIAVAYTKGYWVGQQVHILNDALTARRLPKFVGIGPFLYRFRQDSTEAVSYMPLSLFNFTYHK